MRYLCLVYLSQDNWSACPDKTCFAFAEQLAASGQRPPAGGRTAAPGANGHHGAGEKRLTAMTDGPFAETKEQLAGFYLIDAKDLNPALRWAGKIPPARYGSVEVRPVRELDRATSP